MKSDAKTKIVALIGSPVEHSLSPVMQNMMFARLGFNYLYSCFNVKKEELENSVKGIRAMDFAGANITVPHKIEIMRFLDSVEPVAKKIGAVNTVVNMKGKLRGYNTDFIGIISAIEEAMEISNKKILLIGAGGAARAAAYGISQKNGRLIIANRTLEKAQSLAQEFGCEHIGLDKLDSIKADLLINATSVGMVPDTGKSITTIKQLRNFSAVFDIVYNPFETRLLKDAKKAGCRTIPGLKMLAYQAAASFELWTGKKADAGLMFKIAKKSLAGE